MKATLTISYMHPGQELPYLFLLLDSQYYIFNIPPLYQRFFKYKNFKIHRNNRIFFTRLSSGSFDGLLGYISSFHSSNMVYNTKIYGPLKMNDYLYRRRFSLGWHSLKYSCFTFNQNKSKKGDNVLFGIRSREHIQRIQASKSLLVLLNNLEKINVAKDELNDASFFINEESNKYSDEKATITPIICTNNDDKNNVISYIFQIKKGFIPKIKVRDIKNYKLSYADIKNLVTNQEITLQNGEKLTLLQLVPSLKYDHKGAIAIIDCPNTLIMKQIIENQSFFQKDLSIEAVIHLTPLSIFESEEYQSWIPKFDKNCAHLLSCQEVQQRNFQINFKEIENAKFLRVISYFKKYFPDHFPEIKASTHKIEEIEKKLAKFKSMIPNLVVPNHYSCYEISKDFGKKEYIHRASHYHLGVSFNETKEFLVHYQEYLNKKKMFKAISKSFDPCLVFLGTNSGTPTNLRNVSGIHLNMKGFGAILDCGEGTFYQLLVHYGPDAISDILLNLKVIFISHFHLDHNIGLTEIIYERNKILKRKNLSIEENKLFVIIPVNLLATMEDYSAYIQRFEGVNYIISSDLSQKNHHYQQEIKKNEESNLEPNANSEEMTTNKFHLDSVLSDTLRKFGNKSFDNITKLRQIMEQNNIESIKTVNTLHCEGSNAIILQHKEGVKLVYSGDTKYCDELINEGKNATILIHEATFLERHKLENHSTISEAINSGFQMNAWRTILTHFSHTSYNVHPKNAAEFTEEKEEVIKYAQDNVILAVDHLTAKITEFEYLPAINKCLNILYPK